MVAYGQGYRTRLQVERPLTSPGPKTKRAMSQALKLMGDALPYLPIAQQPLLSLLLMRYPRPRCLPPCRHKVSLWAAVQLSTWSAEAGLEVKDRARVAP